MRKKTVIPVTIFLRDREETLRPCVRGSIKTFENKVKKNRVEDNRSEGRAYGKLYAATDGPDSFLQGQKNKGAAL